MRFSPADIARFAEWSADRNPLHVDAAFARGTFFGRAIVHGMLSVSQALELTDTPDVLRALDIEFRGALFPDETYAVDVQAAGDDRVVTVRGTGEVLLRIQAAGRPAEALASALATTPADFVAAARRADGLRDRPADRSLADLAGLPDVVGAYPAASSDSTDRSTSLRARVLALCSYTVGMEAPGLRSLFTRAEVALAPEATLAPAAPLYYRLSVRRVDEPFRLLDTRLDVADGEGRMLAVCQLRSYVRFSPVVSDLVTLGEAVRPFAATGSPVALVVGGSRGVGADIAAAIALTGATVYVSYRHDADGAARLRSLVGEHGGRIELLPGDAGDPGWCAGAVEVIVRESGKLDVLVLNACAPPVPRSVADGVESGQAYVQANLALVQAPLAAALPALRDSQGQVVHLSSSYVVDLPPKFGHYVALKQAGEALVATAAREVPGIRPVIVRPPPLQTRWNDTPTGALGTIAADRVAVALVAALAAPSGPTDGPTDGPRPVETISEFPALAPARDASASADALLPPLSLAVTASFTADPIEKGLAFWARELGLRPEVSFAPYSQVLQTLFDPASALSTHATGLNVVLLRLQDWLRELPPAQRDDPAFVATHLEATTRDLVEAMRAHRSRARTTTLLLLCPTSATLAPALAAACAAAEAALLTALEGMPGLLVRRAAEAHARFDVAPDAIDDALRDKLGHIPYVDAYFHVLATLVAQQAWRRLVAPRKVVVVDCDNTLWRGVVGEVGAEGVSFDGGHRALHEWLVELSGSGVIVCLCSKNEEEDVWRVFDTRPELLLRRDQVVAAMINWQRKSENLAALAARLNVGLDSFVFLDDNHVECAEVRAGCPGVLTLEWPQDETAARRLLAALWELDTAGATAEDRKRTQMYREEFGRQALRQGASNFRDFLASLDLVVEVTPLVEADLARAAQLTLRTNQFNFTTVRRDESELRALQDGGGHELRTVRVRDRFGDYGLVGLLIAERQAEALVTDTFLMSCRVLGRGAEHRMAAELGRIAMTHGLDSVRLTVEPTRRNAPARAFLGSLCPEAAAATGDGVLTCLLPAATLATLEYDPADGEPEAVDEEPRSQSATSGGAGAVADDDASGARLRQRERTVQRTAERLATQQGLAVAIDGRGVAGAVGGAEAAPDVAAIVHAAFARSLGRPVSEIVAVDGLEALGCDSFRIVEITVGLVEHFPWLPSTLLFEHRSVKAIVEHITRMADARQRPERHVVTAVAASDGGLRPGDVTDIAVVGLDLRCAGAASADELWALLSGGSVAVRPVPVRRRYFTRPLEDDRPHWAGLLDDVDCFDAAFFGIAPREADLMDPQQRLLLEVVWGALEDADAVAPVVDADTGVFVGAMYDDYAHHANRVTRGSGSPYKSWESFSLANRVSQVLGLRGPSLTVDTACSSSGTALHLACRALAAGDCRAAIVAGVNVILDPDRFAQLGRLGILSATGRCLSFGKDADGTVLGEGVGVVVLRSLDVALARGDHIYGVIKGTGVSTGSGTVGFTAPNPQAQAVAIRRAIEVAGVEAATIGYVETHGTATLLGDPIEVRGLTLGYGVEEGRGPARAAIGSIKPNIGHLEAGAAVLSLIKVLLQLQKRTLLPSVSSPELNPQIPFADVPFALQRMLEPWPAPAAGPRRAGVSSFGVGGANVHVILEEAPEDAAAGETVADGDDLPRHLVTLSARGASSLAAQAGQLARHLADESEALLGDVARTLNVTRRAFEHRAALVVADRAALDAALLAVRDGRPSPAVVTGVAGAAPPKLAFLCTGQGAQYPGMSRGLYETQPAFREAFDACAEALDPLLGESLVALVHGSGDDDTASRLDQTRYTQPALFAVEYALGRLWESWGVVPAVLMGHSVGEFAAVCLAGGMTLGDAARLIEARGRLMQALPEGGVMVSVATGEARVREALAGFDDRAAIAGINSPEQTVVSGERAAVEAVVARLAGDGVRTKALTVSHAFHSPLMQPMVDAFRAVVATVAFTETAVPVVSCVTGAVESHRFQDPDYWVRQVLEPVRFADGMRAVHDLGIDAFLETGPQPVLVGLGRRCLGAQADGALWLPSLSRDAHDLETMLGSAGRLFVAGARLDWDAFEQTRRARRVALPHYAFEPRTHWVAAGAAAAANADAAMMRPADVRPYGVTWQAAEPTFDPAAVSQAAGTWLVLADGGEASPLITAELESRGGRCVILSSTGDLTAGSMRDALALHAPVSGVLHLRGLDAPEAPSVADALDAWRRHAFDSAVEALQATAAATPAARVWCVTRGAVDTGTSGDDAPAPGTPAAIAQAALWGLGRTAALEHPQAWGGNIDLPEGAMVPDDARRLVDRLLAGGPEDEVAVRPSALLVPRLGPIERPHRSLLALSPDASYLVTGGMGALGLQVTRWLADRGARHLVLLGRTRRGDDAIAGLQALGVTVAVEVADVADADQVDAVLGRIAASGHPLRGIVHAAGVDRVMPLAELVPEVARDAFAAKVTGGWLLHDRTRALPLDFFVAFSSLAAVLGAAGRAPYAAANAVLDRLAAERRRQGLPAVSVEWGPWAGEGMGAEAGTARQFEAIGNHLIDPAEALHALEDWMGDAASQVVIADLEWARFGPAYEARRMRPLVGELVGRAAPARTTHPSTGDRTPEAVAAAVREEVAAVLGFSRVDDLPLDRGFFEMGLDSLSSVELVSRLRQRFGVDCQGFVFDTPTVAALSDRIVHDVAGGPAAAAAAAPGSVATIAVDADTVLAYDDTMEGALYDFNVETFEPPRRTDWILPRWRWMFEASAARLATPRRVWVTVDEGRMTAHHGAIPVDLQVGPEVHRTAWLVETMVRATHRGRALGPRLLEASVRDLPFALSLGQSEPMREIQFRTGWTQVAPLETAQLLLRPERVLKGKLPPGAALGAGLGLRALSSLRRLGQADRALTLHEVDTYGADHDALWQAMARTVGCAVVRDGSYLTWKYVDQPGQQFLRYDVRDGDRLIGTTVWMLREPDDAYRYRRAFLVDLVADLGRADDLAALLRAGGARMGEAGADAVLCLHTSAALGRALKHVGFSLREPGRVLLVHPEGLADDVSRQVLDGQAWFVTQGDSDIDRPW